MTDVEDKEKAEKVAAARKRFELFKKQKDKAKRPENEKKTDNRPDTHKEPVEGRAADDVGSLDDPLAPVVDNPEDQKDTHSDQITQHVKSARSRETPKTPSDKEHSHQPSLSLQSQLRSSTFRRTSESHAPLSPSLNDSKSPVLPVLSPEGDSVNEIYRKQSSRLDELEKENRRLSKEARDTQLRWDKTEQELEELRESSGHVAELKSRAAKAGAQLEEIEKSKHEIASLQRQIAQLQSQTSKSTRHVSSPNQAHISTPTLEIQAQLESKNSTIESMEMEISNLRTLVDKSTIASNSHSEQVAALEEKLKRAERAAGAAQRELLDVRKGLDRASEKAVKEGSERTSSETKIRSLQREADESRKSAEESIKRVETLEKKLAAFTTLHKETDSRRQAAERERDRVEREAAETMKRLVNVENENLRLREEKERSRKRDMSAVDDDGVDELEDEERRKLEDKVRQLEGELFNLKRGVWSDRRKDLSGLEGDDGPASPGSKFDEVDLNAGPTLFRRQSNAASRGQGFTDVLSSGFNAITGGGHRESHELLESIDDGFDEDAFRAAQEEDSRKRLERVRETKRKLKDWEGWRMDIVDCRIGAGGAGEIFDV